MPEDTSAEFRQTMNTLTDMITSSPPNPGSPENERLAAMYLTASTELADLAREAVKSSDTPDFSEVLGVYNTFLEQDKSAGFKSTAQRKARETLDTNLTKLGYSRIQVTVRTTGEEIEQLLGQQKEVFREASEGQFYLLKGQDACLVVPRYMQIRGVIGDIIGKAFEIQQGSIFTVKQPAICMYDPSQEVYVLVNKGKMQAPTR